MQLFKGMRLDIIELIEYCDAMGLTLTEFVFRMEGRLLAEGLMSPARKEEYLRWQSVYMEYYKKLLGNYQILRSDVRAGQ